MLGKVAWFCALAMLGVLAIGVELDRAGRKDARAAEWVPGPFKGYALETQARDALANGANQEGLALARELVSRRPIPAESLALYTNALLANGQGEAAGPALMLAAQRGWRDRYVQRLMVLVAQQSEDWQSAAQRLIALWRQGDEGEETLALSKAVLSQPEGLRVFLGQFGPEDRWNPGFLAWAAKELPADAVRLAATTVRKRGAPVDCVKLAASTYDLAVSGTGEASAALWDAACGSRDAPSSRRSFAFTEATDGLKGPLDWRYPDQPDVITERFQENSGLSLRYSNAALLRVVIAERFALLSPGPHKAWLEASSQAGINRALMLRVSCFSPSERPFGVGSYELGGEAAEFTIPANCPTQRLDIDAARGDGTIRSLRIK